MFTKVGFSDHEGGDFMHELKLHGVYRHFKGDYYIVEDVARDSETGRKMVVYRKLYGDGSLWVRDKDMFLSEVDHTKYPDVKQKYRFGLQEFDGSKKELAEKKD